MNLQAIDLSWSLCSQTSLVNADADAATAKSLQSRLTLCNPIDGSPPGSPVPGILQARVLECVAISFSIPISRVTLLQLLISYGTAYQHFITGSVTHLVM